MNIVEGRSNLRRLSVPRRTVERSEGDRRQCDRRQNVEAVDATVVEDSNQDAQKKYVRVSLTPGERTLLQDMYLIEDK